MKIIAHRGYSGKYPENTMLGFEKAVEAGCDEIELDVQITKDDILVIIHDEDIRRTTDGHGMVKDYTYQELLQFNAGNSQAEEFGFHPIPTFEEYLDWIKDIPITTNIELKNRKYYYENLEEKTIALVESYQLENMVMLSSSNHASLVKCKQLRPNMECGVIVGKPEIFNAGFFTKTFGFECYHPDFRNLTIGTARNCIEYGIKVNVWNVNTMEALKEINNMGCNGAITDYPDLCKIWLEDNYVSP